MSDFDPTRTDATIHDHHDEPSVERWFVVMLLSLVPAAVALLLPPSLLAPSLGVSGVLFVGSLVMLRVHARQRAGGRAREADAPVSVARRRASVRLEAAES